MRMCKIENACAFTCQTDDNRGFAYAMEGYLSVCGVSCFLLDRAAVKPRAMEVYVMQDLSRVLRFAAVYEAEFKAHVIQCGLEEHLERSNNKPMSALGGKRREP